MKKKGIVLLITLFFITAISVVILKNLEDSQKFIPEVSFDNSLTQLNITNKNVQDEVIKLLNDYKAEEEVIDGILEATSLGIPFDYGDIRLTISLNEYNIKSCNINNIKSTKSLNEKCENIVENILYQYDFVRILKSYQPISNQNQLEYFLDKYIQETRDDKIKFSKDEFETINQKDLNSSRYIECSYDISISDLNVTSNFIFKLGEDKPVVTNIFIDQ